MMRQPPRNNSHSDLNLLAFITYNDVGYPASLGSTVDYQIDARDPRARGRSNFHLVSERWQGRMSHEADLSWDEHEALRRLSDNNIIFDDPMLLDPDLYDPDNDLYGPDASFRPASEGSDTFGHSDACAGEVIAFQADVRPRLEGGLSIVPGSVKPSSLDRLQGPHEKIEKRQDGAASENRRNSARRPLMPEPDDPQESSDARLEY